MVNMASPDAILAGSILLCDFSTSLTLKHRIGRVRLGRAP
jgi:hypothetical protein